MTAMNLIQNQHTFRNLKQVGVPPSRLIFLQDSVLCILQSWLKLIKDKEYHAPKHEGHYKRTPQLLQVSLFLLKHNK